MILSSPCRRRRADLRLTRTAPDHAVPRPAPLPGTLHDPDWAIHEIVEAVTLAPGR